MTYDVTFLKELRGLGEHIKSLGGADKITRIVERCIEIKRQLNKLEKTGKGKDGRPYENAERKKSELLNEYIGLCCGGTEEVKAVREAANCYNYFIDSLKIDCKKTIEI